MTTAEKIKAELAKVDASADKILWGEDSAEANERLVYLSALRQSLQADLQRVTLNPNAVTLGRY